MSLLNQVQKGRKLKPLAIMLHAPHGIGKSTFATEAPNPIYIGNEENDELDVSRFKTSVWVDEKNKDNPNALVNVLESLLNEDHDYKTLVVDTVDGLEQIAEQYILSQKGAEGKTMATAFGGYGKAYEKMANMFLNIKDNYLIPLRDKKGMNIVLLCHSEKVKHEEAMTLTSYDHYEVALHKKTKHLFEDWVSAILFANHYLVRAETNSGKEYAEGIDGMRIIYTEERPSHVAKNRFNLPYEIDFPKHGTWEVIKNHILDHYKTNKKEAEQTGKPVNLEGDESTEIKNKINKLVPKLPEELKASVETSLKRAKADVKELKRILKKIEGALA